MTGPGEGSPRAKGGGDPRLPWVLGAVAGIVVVGSLLVLIRPPPGPVLGGGRTAGAGVGLVRLGSGHGSDARLTEEARLHDPTPLFLPTALNSARLEVRPREPGDQDPFPARLVFPDGSPPVRLEPPVTPPATAAEALDSSPAGAPFLGMGRATLDVQKLPERGATIGVVDARSGRPALPAALADALRGDLARSRPPGALPWRPLQFLAAVSESGLVGPPVLTAGSGVQDVDNYFVRYLVDSARIGERLPPGLYRIDLGP